MQPKGEFDPILVIYQITYRRRNFSIQNALFVVLDLFQTAQMLMKVDRILLTKKLLEHTNLIDDMNRKKAPLQFLTFREKIQQHQLFDCIGIPIQDVQYCRLLLTVILLPHCWL